MATHSSILAWRIPWTEEPGGLQSRAGHKSRDTTEATEHVCTGLRQHRGSPQQLCPQREGATLEVRSQARGSPRYIRGVSRCSQTGQGLLGLLWAQGLSPDLEQFGKNYEKSSSETDLILPAPPGTLSGHRAYWWEWGTAIPRPVPALRALLMDSPQVLPNCRPISRLSLRGGAPHLRKLPTQGHAALIQTGLCDQPPGQWRNSRKLK